MTHLESVTGFCMHKTSLNSTTYPAAGSKVRASGLPTTFVIFAWLYSSTTSSSRKKSISWTLVERLPPKDDIELNGVEPPTSVDGEPQL